MINSERLAIESKSRVANGCSRSASCLVGINEGGVAEDD